MGVLGNEAKGAKGKPDPADVVGSPGGGLVAGLWLPGFTHVQGYQCDGVGLCNKALYNTDTIRKYYGNNPAIKRSFE